MAEDAFPEGTTVLAVTVPEAERVVRRWRDQIGFAAAGMPAHITILGPFLHRSFIDAGVITELTAIFAAHRAFDLRLARCQRFPDVLYLQPEPESPLRALTNAVASRWPEKPPYGGQFADVVPHLTVIQGLDPSVFDTIEAGLSESLPITAHVTAARLHVFTVGRWREELAFPLAADGGHSGGS